MSQFSWENRDGGRKVIRFALHDNQMLADQAAAALREAAGVIDGERVKSRIARAAHAAGLTYWRTHDLWYGRARRIHPAELARIAEAMQPTTASRVPESDLERLRSLESEVAEMRVLLAGALQRLEGQAHG